MNHQVNRRSHEGERHKACKGIELQTTGEALEKLLYPEQLVWKCEVRDRRMASLTYKERCLTVFRDF